MTPCLSKFKDDILIVQIYVDDIIFGSTNPNHSKHFENLMKSKFEMSMMGELKFFLGLQIHQSPRGIFINQAKYTIEILKKHGMENCDSVGTPMVTSPKIGADLYGKPIDPKICQSMIGSLMCNNSHFQINYYSRKISLFIFTIHFHYSLPKFLFHILVS